MSTNTDWQAAATAGVAVVAAIRKAVGYPEGTADELIAYCAAQHAEVVRLNTLVESLLHELGMARERAYPNPHPVQAQPQSTRYPADPAHWSPRMARDARSTGPF